ncbi:MAG TPA: hypothetical protein VEA80_10620 [Vitreimonas sp.]|nr:hypothetical protein [Vitreimonas sp.]HYD87919.1 hypothetical protein [Vitreimonas sp.]
MQTLSARSRQIAGGLGFEPEAIPYADYEAMVTAWLLEAQPPRRRRKGD